MASSCRRKDGSTAKEGIKASTHRPIKSSNKAQEAKDSNDMNLSGLNPEDVKVALFYFSAENMNRDDNKRGNNL